MCSVGVRPVPGVCVYIYIYIYIYIYETQMSVMS